MTGANSSLFIGKSNFRSLRGVTFLFGKKVTKEPTQGRMLTAQSFGTADKVDSAYPDFEPPSPENPSRPLRVIEMLSSRL